MKHYEINVTIENFTDNIKQDFNKKLAEILLKKWGKDTTETILKNLK